MGLTQPRGAFDRTGCAARCAAVPSPVPPAAAAAYAAAGAHGRRSGARGLRRPSSTSVPRPRTAASLGFVWPHAGARTAHLTSCARTRTCTHTHAHTRAHTHPTPLHATATTSSTTNTDHAHTSLYRRRAALVTASLARLAPAYVARRRAVRRWHEATVARLAAHCTRLARRTLEARRSEGLSASGHAVRLALRRWARRTLNGAGVAEWLLAQRCEGMRSAMHRWRASSAWLRLHRFTGVRALLWQ